MTKQEKFWADIKSGKFTCLIQEAARGEQLCSSKGLYNVIRPMFLEEDDVEKGIFVFLDQKNQIIAIEKLFQGSIAGSAIYPREIIKRLLALKANGLVMVHNHPSGDPIPSPEDHKLTRQIVLALCSIGAQFLDHLIVGDDGSYHSMADAGVIHSWKTSTESFLDGG